MKIQYLYTLLVALILLPLAAQAQHNPGWCGTHATQEMADRLIRNRDMSATMAGARSGATIYVPVRFHLVAKGDGTGRISELKAFEQLCALNEFYAQMDVQFYLKEGFSYIDNDAVFSTHDNTAGQFQMNIARMSKTINIYVVNVIEGSGIGVTLGYYDPGSDWIVMRGGEINGSSETLIHEMGHFFSVLHPFNGWDFTPYDPAAHGNPVSLSNDFAPGNSLGPPYQAVKVEMVDGSNCETAGDFLCDTPASYLFFPWSNCNYDGGAQDPDGDLVDPDEYNIMDYFPDPCVPKYFSEDQKAVIVADIMSRTSNGTLENFDDIFNADITDVPGLIEPADGAVTAGNLVAFDWEDVNGAATYLLEIARNASFTVTPKRLLVSGSYKIVEDPDYFFAGQTYHWRVTPFNAGNTCAETSLKRTFVPGNNTNVNETSSFVKGWAVQPNPLEAGQPLNIQLEADKNFDAVVSIYNITGQLLRSVDYTFIQGTNNMSMEGTDFDSGLYLVTIQTADGTLNKKVVIQSR